MSRYQRRHDAGRSSGRRRSSCSSTSSSSSRHAGLAPAARRSDLGGRRAGGAPAAGDLVGVELHDVGHERVRPRVDPRPPAADRRDAGEPADGGRDPGGVRRPRAAVRGHLRRAPGRPAHVPGVRRRGPRAALERARAERILVWSWPPACSGSPARSPTATPACCCGSRRWRSTRRAAGGYRTPGRGASQTDDWSVDAGHFAERFQLFVIIALGESIVVTGATAAGAGARGRAPGRARGRLPGHGGAVVAVLRLRRRALAGAARAGARTPAASPATPTPTCTC